MAGGMLNIDGRLLMSISHLNKTIVSFIDEMHSRRGIDDPSRKETAPQHVAAYKGKPEHPTLLEARRAGRE